MELMSEQIKKYEDFLHSRIRIGANAHLKQRIGPIGLQQKNCIHAGICAPR
jgi:hypothetical protein